MSAYAGNVTTKELIERRRRGLFQSEHVARHFISGVIIFGLGLAADVWISRYLANRPLAVRWPEGITNEFLAARRLPTNAGDLSIQFGLAEDGRAVWRVAKPGPK